MDHAGDCQGVLASFDDVTEIQQRNAALRQMLAKLERSRDQIERQNNELRHLATRDPLTGCLNRRAVFEILEHQFASKVRYEQPLGCIMVDIDHFKSFNDEHGHAVGDDVLKMVASALRETLRNADALCRYGGEEFCIVLPTLDVEGTTQAAERFRQAVSSCKVHDLSVTASFGVSAIELGATDPQELIQQADEALYAAKRTGRDRVCRWDNLPAEVETNELEMSRAANALSNSAEAAVSYQAVNALYSALLLRHTKTADHCRRVADLCVATASDVMTSNDVYLLEVAALLHEFGKIGTPDAILAKDEFSTDEQELANLYNQVGDEVVKSTLGSMQLNSILHNYRNRFSDASENDGELHGNHLPLGARILHIADAYDNMVSGESGTETKTQDEALAELRQAGGEEFDPGLVERFIRSVTERGAQMELAVANDAPEHGFARELSVMDHERLREHLRTLPEHPRAIITT